MVDVVTEMGHFIVCRNINLTELTMSQQLGSLVTAHISLEFTFSNFLFYKPTEVLTPLDL